MEKPYKIPKKITAILIYARPLLVFSGMLFAVSVMLTRNPILYLLGVLMIFTSMVFDLVDGWFAARFSPDSAFAHLADRIMDKLVYSIIFPLISVGMIWRILFISPKHTKVELLHAIFVLFLCITVLVRDNFASFMREFAIRKGQEPEPTEFTRLRTIVAAPLGALLYAHAFYIPDGPSLKIYSWISWMGNIPIRGFFICEIIFLIINFSSIAGYCKKYGTYCLDELCLGNTHLRRRILSFFPNALTVMNAIMGLLSVFFAYQGRIKEAFLIMIGAAIFDKLDGAMARKLGLVDPVPPSNNKLHITFGGIMDDIADTVSFCIAPAWIYYICLSSHSDRTFLHLPISIIASIYTVFGVTRLIYFTLDKNPTPGYFKGMPTPAAALFVLSPLIIFMESVSQGSEYICFWYYFCSGIMIAAAIFMNLYPAKYVHVGRLMDRNPWIGKIDIPLVLLFALTPYLGYFAFTQLFLYAISPLLKKFKTGH
ncbi:MAG: CDP-alcohol phosphatidyltransferase family protein [Deltaproteobacteria bacterium]|nr:CDP-alcohol phosphatidyltransferase family protein [Deltaproteobacteria bacterium]